MPVDIVYSQATGRIRRIIIPSGGAALHSGEAVLTILDETYVGAAAGLDALQQLVNTSTGLTPSGDRYVSVDGSGNVVAAHIADPASGDVSPYPASALTLHASANAGDLFVGGKLLKNKPVSFSSPFALTRHYPSRNDPLP